MQFNSHIVKLMDAQSCAREITCLTEYRVAFQSFSLLFSNMYK